jgi:hypothetical protein
LTFSHLARLFVATLIAAGASGATSATGASSHDLVRVTFVGDSVPASITFVPSAERRLRRGLAVRLDLRVCRRLVARSCSFQGSIPTTALQAVRGYGSALGDVLIVNVGYNEGAEGYRHGIDRVMHAALAQGARGVVWVTLRETRPLYRSTNAAIRTAARRWPQLVVADWNAYSSGHAWFGRDGLHLTETGATELAAFLRRHVDQVPA